MYIYQEERLFKSVCYEKDHADRVLNVIKGNIQRVAKNLGIELHR
jgi:hypothetical protein